MPNYVRYFGSYNVEGVAGSRVEAVMSWVEGVVVGGGGWSLVEVGHGLAIPLKIYFVNYSNP